MCVKGTETSMNKIAQTVYDLAVPLAKEQGIELWDVEYVKEAGQWFLRVYIDKPDGVGIADCEDFSRAFEPILDEKDLVEGSYVFEVSSAGAERELKRPSDFARFIGSDVEVKLYKNRDGAKSFIGKLVSNDDEKLVIETPTGELSFEKGDVALVRLRVIM